MADVNRQQAIERGIWLYLSIFIALTALAWAPFVLHGSSSHHFPLSSYYERFSDLAHFASVHQKLAAADLEDLDHLSGTLYPRNYGSLAVLIYLFLLKVCSPYSIVVFLALVISAMATGAVLLWRAARLSPAYRPFMAVAVFGTGLLAIPTAETLLRGNIEGLLWIGYATGIGLMFSRKWGRSASALAIASCIKPYPLLLLILPAFRQKYRQVALGCLVLLITAVTCLTFVGGGNPERGIARTSASSTNFFASYIVGFRSVRQVSEDHSLFQTSKSVARVVKARGFHLPVKDYMIQTSTRAGYILLVVYVPSVGAFLLLTLWMIRRKPLLTQVFTLSICLTLFPLLAADYTLTILYIPMAFFLLFLLRDVAAGRAEISQARIFAVLVPCSLLMVPLPVLGIWAGDVRSLVLLSLLFIVVDTPMPMTIDLEERSAAAAQMLPAQIPAPSQPASTLP